MNKTIYNHILQKLEQFLHSILRSVQLLEKNYLLLFIQNYVQFVVYIICIDKICLELI